MSVFKNNIYQPHISNSCFKKARKTQGEVDREEMSHAQMEDVGKPKKPKKST